MRIRGISTSLLIVASGMGVMTAPAAGQPQPPPAPRAQVSGPAGTPGLDQILTPHVPKASDKQLIGLPEQAPAELLTWDRAYTLALVRARGGGAAPPEVLDPQALAEQARRHGVADFARFRKDFLAGRPEGGGAFHDPGPAYYAVLRRLQAVDDARRHVATLENLSKLLQDLIQGEAAGLSQFDIDFTSEALLRGRQRMSRDVVGLRDALDVLKVALGLSPHAAVIPDRQALAVFRDVLTAVDAWSRRPDRMLAELPRIVDRLPTPGDALVDGRPILRQIEQAPARMEEVLRDAARLAIKNHAGAGKDRASNDGDVAIELRVRRRIRHLLEIRQAYEEEKRRYVLAIRLKDQAFERIVSPSPGAAVSFRTPVVQGLIGDLGRILESEDRLVALWASFRTERLAFYRDLGALPYDNWDAFYDDLAARHGAFGDIPASPPATPAPPSRAPER